MNLSQDLCSSLIKWLHTFDLRAPHRTVEEISDGVAMAEALGKIAPEWFDSAFISKIKTDVGSNWRLKVSNLKKIVDYILDYYQECLNQQLSNFSKPDVAKIGEYCDRSELGRLLQLLLGCAVNCADKQEYITVIMGMEESVQRVIMQAIQELENGGQVSLGPTEDVHLQRISAELDRVTDERDQMAQKCQELDLQVSLLQEEKSSVLQELAGVQAKLQEAENPASSAVSTSKYGLLRRKYDGLKEDMFKAECARDDARLRLEVQDRVAAELQTRVDELQALADEARLIKDEMDVLRETADKVGKYEATIESYKRKLEELSDLKRQCKIFEDKNAGNLQVIMDLEEELKRQGAWKSQAEAYKKQVTELIQKQKEETNRADKLSFENSKATEKLATLTREKERLIVERNLLREANEELTCQVSAKAGVQEGTPQTVDELNADIRERLAKLMQENRTLKLQQQEAGQLAVVQALLEAANEQVEVLTQESRSANKRILELESQLEETQTGNQEVESDELSNLRKEISNLRGQNRTLCSEVEQLRSKSELQDEQLEESQRRNSQLKDNLSRKEADLSALEEKYKKCMEKAKTVINNLEPKQHSELATMVLDKTRVMARDQPDFVNELKLIATAYHHISSQRHQESVDQRLATLSAGQSFLARQRGPVARKLPNK